LDSARTSCGITVNSTASAGYDTIGELTSWTAKDFGGTSRLNEQLGYAYDAAQNLKLRTNNTLVQTFSVDALNELTNISRAGTLTVSGNTPTPASSVTVNTSNAVRYADFTFASSNGFTLANGNNIFTNIAKNYYGTASVTNVITANLPVNVTPQFDANGNMTNDGTRSLSYDTENQLTNVTVAGQWREDFLYDGMNRRRITRQYIWQSGAWALTNETRFVYDGNVVIQERDSNNVAQVTYTRGLDLSGSLQGAGGIGGLLARTDTNGSAFYHADGNGNITSLMGTNQYIVARYLYDPFGKMLGKWGTLADANVYRFSSKEWDANSGFYYYLYRSYNPNLLRWLNRDPIGERGSKNLYVFSKNSPVIFIDSNGYRPLGPLPPNNLPTQPRPPGGVPSSGNRPVNNPASASDNPTDGAAGAAGIAGDLMNEASRIRAFNQIYADCNQVEHSVNRNCYCCVGILTEILNREDAYYYKSGRGMVIRKKCSEAVPEVRNQGFLTQQGDIIELWPISW
jgi:RHS repeat-associated protein